MSYQFGDWVVYDRPPNRTEVRIFFTDPEELEYLLPIALLDRKISHIEVDGVRYERVEREDG